MKRKALIVGINKYDNEKVDNLNGCVADATEMKKLLSSGEDEKLNFDCEDMFLLSSEEPVTEGKLRTKLRQLFTSDAKQILFYFSGHGFLDRNLGGYLAPQDVKDGDPGIFMGEVKNLIENADNDKEIIIILDCCHSGHMGNTNSNAGQMALVKKGVYILAACTEIQKAWESKGRGLFTSAVEGALKGGAADILGNITMTAVHNHVNQLLAASRQQPIFKTYTSKIIQLRKCPPKIEMDTLLKITDYFPNIDDHHHLSPAYEPSAKPKNKKKEKIFGHLQEMRALNLVEPCGKKHMYYAAMKSKSCKLTLLGQFYWKMIDAGSIKK